jgi:hypothetical protein
MVMSFLPPEKSLFSRSLEDSAQEQFEQVSFDRKGHAW